jgi:diguanylate cyclase (GGDEF)-like protein/PAS domain S-box-containing protein
VPAAAVRILLVEDNAGDALLTSDMLAFSSAPHYEVTRVACLADARALLAVERFEAILLDLGLPDATGLDGVRAVRAAAPDAAIVVLSGLGSEAVAVEALAAGAQDYLVKGRADEDALQRSIRFAITRREADVAQRRLAAIVESSADAILTKDLDTRITSWNRGAEQLYGYSREEAVGQRLSMLIPPELAGEEASIVARVRDGDRIQSHQTTRVRRDGQRVSVSLTVSGIPDAQGDVTALSVIARDVTDSTRAAASLRAAQERFRVAFEEAPIGMALFGLDRRFIKVNAALCEMMGYESRELEGRPTSTIVHPDDPEREGAAVRALLGGNTSRYSADRHFVRAGGQSLWVALNVACVRNEDGEPQHFLAQAQDITDRRRYEAQLQHMADHDPLTGLLNRRAFERELRGHIMRGERYGPAGAALMIDVDHFKYYNDTLGHQAGDRLIMRVAAVLAGRLRKSDVLARLGGDEFAVILPGGDEAAVRQVVTELLECVRGEGLLAPDGSHHGLTASIGVAFFDDQPGLDPEEVMVNADLAMYDAKESGRDRAAFHRSAEPPRTRTRTSSTIDR